LDDLDPKICSALVDGKGNIIGSNNHGTIYNMPEVSDQLTGLSELRKDYDLRKSRLEGIEKENNPWDKIETSQKSLKQFVL
jgi:hypothetical protein